MLNSPSSSGGEVGAGRRDGEDVSEDDMMGKSTTEGALLAVLVGFGLGEGDRAMDERDLKWPKGLADGWGLEC